MQQRQSLRVVEEDAEAEIGGETRRDVQSHPVEVIDQVALIEGDT